jgi:hypothetical protein
MTIFNSQMKISRVCIGIGDVKQFQIKKTKEPTKERQSWSGKKKIDN